MLNLVECGERMEKVITLCASCRDEALRISDQCGLDAWRQNGSAVGALEDGVREMEHIFHKWES